MLRKTLALALLIAPFTLGQSSATDGKDVGGGLAETHPVGCLNLMVVEPLVIFDVSGSTLQGSVDRHLAVYSNGRASYTSLDGGGLQQVGSIGTVASGATVFIGVEEASQLLADLLQGGADDLCDQETYVTEMPLKTLTIMGPGTDSDAHTFSYWHGVQRYSRVSSVLDAFVATYFVGI